MSDVDTNKLGKQIKKLLEEQKLSMRMLSAKTGIDTATISRIINGKRKAKPEHLQKFAECLHVPIADLFKAAGFPIEQKLETTFDLTSSVNSIQDILAASELYEKNFTIGSVKQKLEEYKGYVQTNEGTQTILNKFESKLQSIGAIGPFISQLKGMYERFRLRQGTPVELILIGAALLYFISPVDVIPDYIFPIGYLDDAMAVQIIADILNK
ncbi:helix-turn-helix domain-containing protein [Heyndrickxia acidicola]|uniref:Helix-turn-helix domain-containing protein n=1 Tax=Heyndrickxia acidicola TaxID=209389 RepID=A0ABU6MIS5_9BACI|nr:helix-turn-helix domain-containing protein [Heyndrickxia acidicola]MED1204425.1 helix-turn-helix domain-containing protein [Heyndrickxia acidicola]